MKKEGINIDFENSIGPWLGKTAKIADGYLHELFRDEGLDLSKEQMVVLKKLHDKDGLNQNELAFLTFRDKSSLARLLTKMERKSYILRKQDAGDKRINRVFLSEKGKVVFRQTKPVLKKMISTMEQNITEEEKYLMIQTLKKVQYNFTKKTAEL